MLRHARLLGTGAFVALAFAAGPAYGVGQPPVALDKGGSVVSPDGSVRYTLRHANLMTSVTAARATDGKRLWQRETDTENLSTPVFSAKSNTLYFANRFGRLLALDASDGTVRWRTSALRNPGDSTDETEPYILLVKDALVAVAGDTAFSVRPDRPVLPR